MVLTAAGGPGNDGISERRRRPNGLPLVYIPFRASPIEVRRVPIEAIPVVDLGRSLDPTAAAVSTVSILLTFTVVFWIDRTAGLRSLRFG